MVEICRAITFMNHHIPYREYADLHFKYITLGFFDGMDTQLLHVDYKRDGLQALWRYVLERTAQNRGLYSFQNLFCFSDDAWNNCRDSEFWEEDTDRKYPLTFVSLLQLNEYSADKDGVRKKCMEYRNIVSDILGDEGRVYVYGTIDKNDFVVCMKCTHYEKAVKTIKEMHRAHNTIYSYTVFSVMNRILENLNGTDYKGLFQQHLPSICLKGVANSYDPLGKVTLDKRYYNFCMRLVSSIYVIDSDRLDALQGMEAEDPDWEKDGGKKKIKIDYKIYDILGDDDFRLIVRNVNLGRLLKLYADDGMLSYKNDFFRFSLFSSGLLLNTETKIKTFELEKEYIDETLQKMHEEFQTPKCDLLESGMRSIKAIISGEDVRANEKIITCCHAMWQLIQSMKALEVAPTKKYDFLSLYYPLQGFVNILEQKISSGKSDAAKLFVENENVFDFIQKISMTIHGTLRTDIQFFQIRDFNSIIDYAPAKLRAFYTLWTFKIKDYYKLFGDHGSGNEYSFIFSPGMFSGTSVRQLLKKNDEEHRLMLITVPERHLYNPKWLSTLIVHESGHFVGWKTRSRPYRQEIWVKCCARILLLEVRKYVMESCPRKFIKYIQRYYGVNGKFEEEFLSCLENVVKGLTKHEPLWPHQYHSENSINTINQAFCNVGNIYIEKLVGEECERIANSIISDLNSRKLDYKSSARKMKEIRSCVIGWDENIGRFYDLFKIYILPELLEEFRYISSEAYSDVVAILTLNLTPVTYLSSFFFCELDRNYLKKENRDMDMILPLRIALTVRTINTIVSKKENGKWLRDNEKDFYDAWFGDVLLTLPQKFPYESVEADLAIKCYAIFQEPDYGLNIGEYRGVYQAQTKEVSFAKTNLFADQKIRDTLLKYLKKCAEDYLSILMVNETVQKKKKDIVSVYSSIAGNSANRMMQGMERFLIKECMEAMGVSSG